MARLEEDSPQELSPMLDKVLSDKPVFVVPPEYEPVKELPSGFKWYSKGTSFYIRPLKGKEAKILAEKAENSLKSPQEFERVLNSIMKDNVILTNMNYDDLILKDRFYLVILIITITYSNKNFQLKWNCTECQTTNGHHLEMDSIFISDVKEDLDPKKIQKLVDGTNFIYHPVTIKKRREAIELVEESEEYDVQYLDIVKNLSLLNTKSSLKDLYHEFEDEVSIQDQVMVDSFIDENSFGVIPNVPTECTQCGGKTLLGLTFRGGLFIQHYVKPSES